MAASKRVTQIDLTIANRAMKMRQGCGYSMRFVADRLGFSYQYYQKMERGQVAFRASTVKRLATIFGVPVSTMYED